MDTGQKTESIAKLVEDVEKGVVALPEFQRNFVWEIEKTFDLFDLFARDIFIGSLIYGLPSFEITTRDLDQRPRTGKGARAPLKPVSYTKEQIDKRVKMEGFRLLLDGQQRATSIYRALKGIDPVFFIVKSHDELDPEVQDLPLAKRTLEQVLSEFRGSAKEGAVSIPLRDVYRSLRGEAPRESDLAKFFVELNNFPGISPEQLAASKEFEVYLSQLKNLENLFRQEKLVSYYLLDTDEEKFAVFFERSNTKGIQLDFIDILAAKLYAGFNLRNAIEDFEKSHPTLRLNREIIVRAIAFRVSNGKETGRAFILSSLAHAHFNGYWAHYVEAFTKVYDHLLSSHMVISQGWIPYENMTMPLMVFISNHKYFDFSQVTAEQARLIEAWYWLAILARRYSSAAQTAVLEDAQAFEQLAKGDPEPLLDIIQRLRPIISSAEDLFVINKRYDAIYKGVLNLINFTHGGFLNWENGNPISPTNNPEDHHIFPDDYLKKSWAEVQNDLDSEGTIDCVVNRTLIPKITNIRVGNKAPSVYLNELAKRNHKLPDILKNHLIEPGLMSGDYDREFEYFLNERGDAILKLIADRVISLQSSILKEHGRGPDVIQKPTAPAPHEAPQPDGAV